MITEISNSPGSRHWRELYKAALYEVDKNKISGRIAQAEKAIVLRARELFQATGDNSEETEALDDVMYALHALESNPQTRQAPEELRRRVAALVRYLRGLGYQPCPVLLVTFTTCVEVNPFLHNRKGASGEEMGVGYIVISRHAEALDQDTPGLGSTLPGPLSSVCDPHRNRRMCKEPTL